MTLVALCQLALAVGRAEANRAAAREAITRSAAEGARLVVLPELTNSGYVFGDAEEARGLAEHLTGPTVREWAALAREHDLVVVGGLCERDDDGAVRNSAVLVDAGG